MEPVTLFAIILFIISTLLVSNIVAPDMAALLGLVAITLFGFISFEEAFSGFVSPSVITLTAMFFVAAALKNTGVTEVLALQVCRVIGKRQSLVVATIMLLGGLISAGMSNVAAVAVMIPAVMLIAHKTELPPGKLLMPLTFAVVLGGVLTSIGTTTNLVIIDIMNANAIEPFDFLSFTPYGAILLLAGILFVAPLGVKLIPIRRTAWRRNRTAADFARLYNLGERLFSLKVPAASLLSGLSLEQAKFASIFGAQVLAIRRGNQKILYPRPDTIIYAEDTLVVQGRKERVEALLLFAGLSVSAMDAESQAAFEQISGCRIRIKKSDFCGQTLRDLHFRERFAAEVIAISCDDEFYFSHLAERKLQQDDILYVLASQQVCDQLKNQSELEYLDKELQGLLDKQLFVARLPAKSALHNHSINSARIGELVGVQIIAIIRSNSCVLMQDGSEILQAGDALVVTGNPDEVSRLGMLGSLQLQSPEADYPQEVKDMVMAELILAPRSSAIGKNLVEVDFREKYNFQVMAIWHEGRPRRSNLANINLKFGDALLVHGPRDKLSVLKDASDFVLLSSDELPPFRPFQALMSVLAFAFITLASVLGLFPVHFAAVLAALIVILSGALKMEDGYKEVNWKIIFVVAALIPFGIAFSRSGLASVIADFLALNLSQHNFWLSIIVLSLATSFLSQIMDGVVAVLLVTPVAIQLANKMHNDPHIILMAVAVSASIAFITPFSHKANLLVMGAGGYRVTDYTRLGLPLSAISFLVLWLSLAFFA